MRCPGSAPERASTRRQSRPSGRPPSGAAGSWAAGLAAAIALSSLACSSLPFDLPGFGSQRPVGERSTGPAPIENPDFSGESAFVHLEALHALGPRPAGSEALAEARSYVGSQLEALGAEVVPLMATVPVGADGAAVSLGILTAEWQGESSDAILLVAPLDTAPVDGFAFAGANEGASGPAVLIELARVLTQEPLPYTLQMAFPEGDRLRSGRSYGSDLLVSSLIELKAARRLRAVVYLDAVGDVDLRIERDGNSNRGLRAAIFDTAPVVGQRTAFPADSEFATPPAGHMAFTRLGIPAVLLTDTAFGAAEPPGPFWRSEQDTPAACSPQSLEAVGDVLTAAIRIKTRGWKRIDALVPDDFEPPPPVVLEEPAFESEVQPHVAAEPDMAAHDDWEDPARVAPEAEAPMAEVPEPETGP